MKRILTSAVALLVAGYLLQAANYYVSKNGSNSAGTSWATAWNEMDQVKWPSLNPGDKVHIDGGPAGMTYTTTLTSGQAGTAGQRIIFARSNEAGHNGSVTMGYIKIDHPYITLDGGNRGKFLVTGRGGYLVRITGPADFFELRNITVRTVYEEGWGTPFFASCLHLLVKGCTFDGTSHEDQIKWQGWGGTLVLEDNHFYNLTGHGTIHEDIVALESTASVDSIIVRRNIFTTISGTDCFMMGRIEINYMEVAYNVFSVLNDGLKFQSCKTLKVYNNVFDRCRDILGSVTSADVRNNIYKGPSWSGPVHIGRNATTSLWTPGTTYYVTGSGNQQADPQFVNADDPAGPDKIPFTADDGFRLQPGSPAIDTGVDVGYTSDIMGTAVDSAPDIGPYEYSASAILYPRLFAAGQELPLKQNSTMYDLRGTRVDKKFNGYSGIYLIFTESGGIVRKAILRE